MKIVGDHIVLRNVENRDLEFLYKWENDADIQKFNADKRTYSKKEIQEFIDGLQDIYFDKQLRLIIDVKKTDESIGTLDIFDFDVDSKSFGVGIIIFEQKNRGNGHASKAMDIFLRYASSHLGTKKIYSNIDPQNEISVKFFRSKGFEKVPTNKLTSLSDKKIEGLDFYVLNIR